MAEAVRSEGVTYAEYLAAEVGREPKHDYLDGVERAMSGGTIEHGRLAMRFARLLGSALDGRPCEVLSCDVRVRVEATNRSFFPDSSVVCSSIEVASDDAQAIINPIVIVEVLSPATEGYDRGEKFRHYARLPSLKEYVLVSSVAPFVEVWRRAGELWRWIEHARDAVVELESIQARVAMHELYRDPFGA
ncbi:MAG: Uma2 family endonuclease [Sandaracinaceae bacterium]